jgi:hypothetical protein
MTGGSPDTDRQAAGPRRSESIGSYLAETRALAAVAILALAGGVVSDVLDDRLWSDHALLAGLVASVIVVMLTVAVVNEAAERRRRQHWSMLAQLRNAPTRPRRALGLERSGRASRPVAAGHEHHRWRRRRRDPSPLRQRRSHAVRDTPIRELVADAGRRELLHDEIVRLAEHCDEVLGRSASVMLNADAYAAVLDRHVELAGDLAWLGGLLEDFEPPDDRQRSRKRRSHPAAQVEPAFDDDRLADRVVVIA